MSTNPPPSPNVSTFNNLYWIPDEGTGITTAQGDARYLKFPVAQGTEALQTININGITTAYDDINIADGVLGTSVINQTGTTLSITPPVGGIVKVNGLVLEANVKQLYIKPTDLEPVISPQISIISPVTQPPYLNFYTNVAGGHFNPAVTAGDSVISAGNPTGSNYLTLINGASSTGTSLGIALGSAANYICGLTYFYQSEARFNDYLPTSTLTGTPTATQIAPVSMLNNLYLAAVTGGYARLTTTDNTFTNNNTFNGTTTAYNDINIADGVLGTSVIKQTGTTLFITPPAGGGFIQSTNLHLDTIVTETIFIYNSFQCFGAATFDVALPTTTLTGTPLANEIAPRGMLDNLYSAAVTGGYARLTTTDNTFTNNNTFNGTQTSCRTSITTTNTTPVLTVSSVAGASATINHYINCASGFFNNAVSAGDSVISGGGGGGFADFTLINSGAGGLGTPRLGITLSSTYNYIQGLTYYNNPIRMNYAETPTYEDYDIGYTIEPAGTTWETAIDANTVYAVNSVTLTRGVWLVKANCSIYTTVNQSRVYLSLNTVNSAHLIASRTFCYNQSALITTNSVQTQQVFVVPTGGQTIYVLASSNLAQPLTPVYFVSYQATRLA